MRRTSIRAFAKVNLDLRVLQRRTDGFHEIRTIFQTIALYDTLSFVVRRGPLEIRATGEPVPVDETNLVWRAARSVWQATGRRGEPHGLAVLLAKRIPVQAGLGGGSSDAAASLLALNRLWRAGLTGEGLTRLAASLGSDVPFFLSGGTALGLGRGDLLYPLPRLAGRHIVLARPDVGISTAEAYEWLRHRTRAARTPAQRLEVPWTPGAIYVANDFESVVCPRHRTIARLLRALRVSGSEVAMLAGSGSAVFGLFRSLPAAREAAHRLRTPGVRVWQTRLHHATRGVRF